jgi:Fe2+ or Zn2+ uptake regulation protein
MVKNTLSLQSAHKILEYVLKNDGLLTWYNIVRYIDRLPVEKIPPSYHVLQQLVNEGYLQRDTQSNENGSKYLITERARQYLGQPVQSRAVG